MKKNGILTLLFAFIPGAGQMYQGYMKRGLSLMLMAAAISMAAMLIPPIAFALLVVFMYSFFDTFNLRAQISMGTAPEDDYLVHFDPQDKRLARMMMDSHKLVGWALIALGAMVAYQNIIMRGLVPDRHRCADRLRADHYEHAGRYPVALGPEGSGMAGHLSGDGSTARGCALRGADPVRHLAGAWAQGKESCPGSCCTGGKRFSGVSARKEDAQPAGSHCPQGRAGYDR